MLFYLERAALLREYVLRGGSGSWMAWGRICFTVGFGQITNASC
jgi:hypothetical protein